jgi:hypothetical protein
MNTSLWNVVNQPTAALSALSLGADLVKALSRGAETCRPFADKVKSLGVWFWKAVLTASD